MNPKPTNEYGDPDEEFDIREMYPLMDEALRDIIYDPAMDVYNVYLPEQTNENAQGEDGN